MLIDRGKGLETHDIAHRLVQRLRLRHLALLIEIDRLGSLTKVADLMAMTQPAVTQALAEVEQVFGTPLFLRSSRGMEATAQGQIVISRARAMVQDMELLSLDLQAHSMGRQAHLRLGVIPLVSGKLVSTALRATRPQGQVVSVSITEGLTETLLEQLRDHALDAVVARSSPDLNMKGLRHEALYAQQPRLIASRELAGRLGRRKLDWAQLQDLDWILGPRNTPMRRQVANLFLRAGLLEPVPSVETSSPKLIGELIVNHSRAVSVVPTEIAEELVRVSGVAIVPYSFEWGLSPIALFTRVAGQQRPVDKLFAQELKRVCTDKTVPLERGAFFY
ncbi:LysR substrate-binding domain-containing protein [Alcaligenes sp. PF14]|uniref:LysR substrate-binding domain-containing protein n=1 Tax=Alcaligenes sp. PF14 TaxID=3120297 RepID=UPI003019E705